MITRDDIIVRTIVDLPQEQIRKLALFCRREKISRAEAVRRAVDRLLTTSTGGDLRSRIAWRVAATRSPQVA